MELWDNGRVAGEGRPFGTASGIRHPSPSIITDNHFLVRLCDSKVNCLLCRNFAVGRVGMRHGNAISILPHAVKMELDCIPHSLFDFIPSLSCCHATGKIWRECGVSRFCFFNNHKVLAHFNPACFRMLLSVPEARSSPVLPAIVTRPGLDGCLYCRWLPRVATKYHPSCRIILTTSRTFTFRI